MVSGTQAVLSSVAMPGTRPVIHTHARQLAACQAGGQTVTLGIGLEGDVPGGHKTIVEINIDAIGAWRNLLAFFKSRQVSHRRRIVS